MLRLLLTALILAASPAVAQNVAFGGMRADISAPVEVAADNLSVNQADGSAVFTGNVVIGQGEMRLSADSVTVGTELSPAQVASNEPIAEIEVYAGPGPLPQAIQEEFGNYRQGPRPFIRPAFDAHVNGAMRNVGERGIGSVLDAAKKG